MRQLNKTLPITMIELSGSTQQRPLDQPTVDRYVELARDGTEFPAIEVIFDGTCHWLWDGFHRLRMHQILERKEIRCNIADGTQREAQWLSLGANGNHGLPRPYGSLRGIVATVLNDAKWSEKSDIEIARHIHCTRQYVHDLRCPKDVNILHPEITEQEELEENLNQAFDRPIGEGKPPVEMKDCEGNVIPKDKQENWLSRAVIQSRINELDQIKNSIKHSIEDGQLTYCLMNQTGFEADIQSLRNRLISALPYAVCCYCGGKGCNPCHNMGFLNEPSWKASPKK